MYNSKEQKCSSRFVRSDRNVHRENYTNYYLLISSILMSLISRIVMNPKGVGLQFFGQFFFYKIIINSIVCAKTIRDISFSCNIDSLVSHFWKCILASNANTNFTQCIKLSNFNLCIFGVLRVDFLILNYVAI